MTAPPLEGIRVLEVGNYMAGPFCGMQLADLGADVVKIEDPRGGDLSRRLEPLVDGESGNFVRLNRGKRSVALDLKQDAGAEIFRRLAERTDVIVENLRPGTMRDLGLDPQSLLDANPRLIYAAVTGWGLDGPYADRPALDIIVQAMSGLMSVTGEEGGAPVKVGVSISDLAAGLYATIGVLAALRRRNQAQLIPLIEAVTATRPAAHWLAVLRAAGVPCGEIQDYGQVFADPHLRERGFFVDLPHAKLGNVRVLGTPLRLRSSPARLDRAGPLLGEHSAEVLREIGHSDDEVRAFVARGTVAAA